MNLSDHSQSIHKSTQQWKEGVAEIKVDDGTWLDDLLNKLSIRFIIEYSIDGMSSSDRGNTTACFVLGCKELKNEVITVLRNVTVPILPPGRRAKPNSHTTPTTNPSSEAFS